MKKCPQCDSTLEDDSRFCKYCGASAASSPLGPAVRPAPAGATASASAPGGQAAAPAAALKPAAEDKAGDVYRDPKFEKQVWQGRPAWRSYWGLWVVWLVASLVCLVFSYRWAGGASAFFKTLLLLSAGTGVAILVREALLVFSLRYRLTTQRLFVHRGILSRVTDQMELIRVDDVRLRQGLVDRIVNTGDVEVIGTDATDQNITLESVSAPAEVAEALRLHVRGARSKGTVLVESI